jgi:hypothetical protein
MTHDQPDDLPDDTPLSAAKEWLRKRVKRGAKCPLCTQLAKVYRRKINSRQAQALILVYRTAGRDWCHVPTADPRLAGDGGELSRLRYWGLLEESEEERDDGGRAGWWRITDAGERWLRGVSAVPKYARIYDSRCLDVEGPGQSIRDALGSRFNYDELMAGI